MINDNFKIEKQEGQTFDPIPENVYQVELLDIEVQEKPKYKQPDQNEKVFSMQFVLLTGKDKKGETLRGRNIWLNFVPTYLFIGSKGKNKLFQVIEALLGRELTQKEEAEMEAVKMNKLIGKQCRIVTENKTNEAGKTFSNIKSLLPAEDLFNALTEEEKEKARIKPKHEDDGQEVPGGHVEEQSQEEVIDVSNIPF